MTGVRVGLYITSLLGALYALLSIINGSNADVLVGMAVAGAGILGWGAIDIWEELR